MHRGLLKLMRLQLRAVFRRMFRGVKTVKGVIFFTIGAVMFVTWFSSTIMGAVMIKHEDPQRVLTYFPLAMLAFCLTTLITTAGERAIAFSPAEVDFLFPGPFSRRQLLGYKIARSVFGAIFTALLFSFVFLRFASHWICGWVAIFLALIFIQLFSMTIVLIGQTIGERAYTSGRKLALIGVIIAVAAIALPGRFSGAPQSAEAIVQNFTHSPSGKVVLAPF